MGFFLLLLWLLWKIVSGRQNHLAGFIQRPQTASANMHPAHSTVDFDPHALDVRLELTVGGPL